MAKHYHSLVFFIFFLSATYAQTTDIPDPNFEQALIDLGIDTDGLNGSVATSKIRIVTSLDVKSKNISDLSGIEGFTSLVSLNCNNNLLTNINLTLNTALTQLNCFANQLSTLDVSKNTLLTYLSCPKNNLTSLDVSQNTALTYLSCSENQLTSLDVTQNSALNYLIFNVNSINNINLSQNTALKGLTCYSNLLTSLDVTQNTTLLSLDFYDNQVTTIDLTHNTVLTYLQCHSNNLTSLNLTMNMALEYLFCSKNRLVILDLSQNPNLKNIYCQENLLSSVNVKNGNNTKISLFSAVDNSSLECIQVDNEVAANSAQAPYEIWYWFKDDTATYSEDCASLNFEDELLAQGLSFYPNPAHDILTIDSNVPLTKVEIYSVYGQKIKEISSNFKNISTDNLSTGMYVFKIYSESDTAIKKLIKN